MRVAVYTIKGGVGKTSVVLFLGMAFAMIHNKKVLLVDTDLQGDLTYRVFDNERTKFTVTGEEYGVARFATTPNAEFRAVQVLNNLYVAPMEYDAFLSIDSQQTIMRRLSDIPADQYDIVLFDTPPSFDRNSAAELLNNVDAFFTVVAPAYQSISIVNAELRLIVPSIATRIRNVPYFIGVIRNDVYGTTSLEILNAINSLNEVCDGMHNVPHFKPCVFGNSIARRQRIFNYNDIAYNIKTGNTRRLASLLTNTNADKVAEEFLFRLSNAKR